MNKTFQSSLSAILLAGGLLAAGQALSQDSAGSETDPVLATVNGTELRASDVIESARDLPAQYQTQIQTIFPALVERLIDFTLLDQQAAADGLDDDEQVLAQLERLKLELMRDALLERVITEEVSDSDVEEAYQDYLEANPPATEIKARHILLETQEEAAAVIAELDAGGDFAELAKEKSTGPTGPNGGDLGYFVEGQMVEPFSVAAFALEPGSYTAEPVETQFGWHVILVEDKREQAQPTIDELRNQLVEQLSRQAVEDYIAGLRDSAEITLMIEEESEEPADQAEEPAAENESSGQ